jgi:ribosome-binding factor A
MPREFSRAQRVGEQIRRELADILARKINDPRLHTVTVSAVEVSPDLSQARIYVTPPAGADAKSILAALGRASGFVRRELAHRLRTRGVPQLVFAHDTTLDTLDRLSVILGAQADSGQPHADEEDDADNVAGN